MNAVTKMEPRQIAERPVTSEGQHFDLMQRKATLYANSPLIPDTLRAGGQTAAMANCYIGLVLAEAMGVNELTVLQNIHVVKGKAGFSAQFMIARANSSGAFRGRIDWRIEGKGDNLAVTAFAVVADTGQEVSVTCDMAMAKAEGWTSNPKYKSMPEVMLRYRSATFLVRFYAPDVMFGYQTAEEVEDMSYAGGITHNLTATPLTGAALLEQAKPETASQAETDPHPSAQSDALRSAIAALLACPTEDALDSMIARDGPTHAELFTSDEMDELDAAVAERRLVWRK